MDVGPPALLEPRLVGDVQGSFFVPDYQRGYRWGPDEVRRLLDDINAAGDRNYFLQPIVVKRRPDDQWELVDGQQRLTTLYLILHFIQRHMPTAKVRYSLSYETRPGSAEYLDAPTEAASLENIDFFHIFGALETIEAWFGERQNEPLAAIELFRALSKTVYVIWYEAPDTAAFDSRTLFTRLNVGRIPLTDAELVKALLLSRAERKEETAALWDAIERDLHNPEVWGFATATADGGPTRIGLLLDTIADQVAGRPPGPSRPLYFTFETLRPLIEASPRKVWDRIVDLHSLVQGWYDDRNLFHKIGYLVASGGASFFDLVGLAQLNTKSGFDSALDALIRKSLSLSRSGVASLTYGARKTEQALLLMNVETVRRRTQSSERYSFDSHAQRHWSIEHIHAQRSQGLNTVEQWQAWLLEHRKALDALDLQPAELGEITERIDRALPTISSETFEPLHQELTGLFTARESDDDPPGGNDYHDMDGIANLALLAGDDNRLLGNEVFEVKRRRVIDLDQRGVYIPVCTRNVFLKYYTDAGARQLHFWGLTDRERYVDAMLEALETYLLEDLPDNDPPDDDVTDSPA